MKNLLKPLLPLIAVVLFIASCQKEPDGSILGPPTVKCSLVLAQYLDVSGTVDDTSGYVYIADKLARINHMDYYNTLTYTGSRITRKTYFATGSTVEDSYDQFSYNPDGTVSKAEYFITDPSSGFPVLAISIEISYSGGKPIKVVEKIDTNNNAIPDPLYEYAYTYTGNNITRCVFKDLIDGTTVNIDFEYDTNPNYFPKEPPAFFTDFLFEDYAGDILPLIFSANNVTKITQTGATVLLTYVTDSNKNLTELRLNGQAIVRYGYKCQ